VNSLIHTKSNKYITALGQKTSSPLKAMVGKREEIVTLKDSLEVGGMTDLKIIKAPEQAMAKIKKAKEQEKAKQAKAKEADKKAKAKGKPKAKKPAAASAK
jgi:hypothetical protein